MPDQAVNALPATIVGLFGKMPAHGDFVRRALPSRVTQRLDDWLQMEFGRDLDPAAAIAKLPPLRLASVDIEPGRLALGAMITSYDKVGRRYPLIALRLSALSPATASDRLPAVWDSWCGLAETRLLAARDESETADTLLANLDLQDPTAAAGTGADGLPPGTWTWRSAPLPEGEVRTAGLPRGTDFDRLVNL